MVNNVNLVVEYILKYGIIFLFFIVYLQYLNLPGLPGGVILPAIGVLIDNNKYKNDTQPSMSEDELKKYAYYHEYMWTGGFCDAR